jgi:TRAP-type C4-dicarboxylate transport system substrate-binding protein
MMSAPIILAFVEQVQQRSGGSLVIEPVWEAGADTEAEYEQGVIAAVRAGEYELGLAATRAWEEQGVTVFQPLQMPFLIDNDALAIAVATSEVATQMLEGLSAAGLAGLAMWPEDLRHPFSVVPGQPLLSPGDFVDKTIRTTSMDVTAALVEALGGTPEFLAFEYQGAESGLRQGASLTGLPVATGNVVFFTKFQVLFANSAAFENLDEVQRAILREAAAAAQQKAIAERPQRSRSRRLLVRGWRQHRAG